MFRSGSLPASNGRFEIAEYSVRQSNRSTSQTAELSPTLGLLARPRAIVARQRTVGPVHHGSRWRLRPLACGAASAQCRDQIPVFTLHCTKKLLDRLGEPAEPSPASPGGLGNWYATTLLWRPQLVLLVNEQTLLPVLVLLAPAATLLLRLPNAVGGVLAAHGVPDGFQRLVVTEMQQHTIAKTASRSMLGMLNEFSFLAQAYRERFGADWVGMARQMAETPCSPLKGRAPADALHSAWRRCASA